MSLFDVETDAGPENWSPFGDEFIEPDEIEPDDGVRRPMFDKRTGQYRDLPPVPGYESVKRWTRVTTLKTTLEDQWRLEAWKRRMVFYGIKVDPKILQEVTHQLDPSTRFGKERLDALAERAIETAGSHTGRDAGSNLHDVIERDTAGTLDRSTLEEHEAKWLDGYHDALSRHNVRLLPEYSERTVVIPEIGCAGTFDTLADHDGRIRVADTKTQKWKPGQFDRISLSVQLGSYSRASFVLDPDTWSWQNMPQVEQDWGLIIWAPATTPGVAKIHKVDLRFGWDMALMSRQVRELRNSKGVVVEL